MELASMLAGEAFSDQPASVSPVVAAFLRAYNDAATEEQRQRLYRYAADALGTLAPTRLERRRARRCLRELGAGATPIGRCLRVAVALLRPALVAAAAGRRASHSDASRGDECGLRFADELIAMSRVRVELAADDGAHGRPDLHQVVGIG